MTLILPYLLAAAAAATPTEASHLTVENCQIGEIYAFNASTCEIALRNDGAAPIHVSDIKAAREGDSVETPTLTIAPHAAAYIKAKINSSNGMAMSPSHLIRFRTDEHGHEDRSGAAQMFTMSVLDEPRPQIDFGVVQASGAPARKSIELSSHDFADFRITKVLEAPAWLEASVSADGHSVSAAVKPDAGWGLHADFLKVAINAPQQGQAWIEVKGDVHGDVVPGTNPYDMSLMRIGSEHEFRIPLRSRTGRAFQVGKIELEGMHGTTQLAPCEKPGGSCQMLIVKVEDQQAGAIKGHVWIELPDFHQRLHLAMGGLLVARDAKIKTIDLEKLAHDEAAAAEGGQTQDKSIDLQHAVKDAVSKADASANVTPPGNGPLLKWAIANGLAVHGFQIFRGAEENGPFVLLNQKSIPSIAQTQDSISYQWRDNSTVSGKTYWYYIGIVYNDGRKQQLTGPQKVVAK
jgi:hypothetical protein